MKEEKKKNNFDVAKSRVSGGNFAVLRALARKTLAASALLVARIARRIVEVAVSIPVIVLFVFPLALFRLIMKILTGKPVFKNTVIYGKGARPLDVIFFDSKFYFVRKSTLFLYVLTGNVRLVGVGVEELGARSNAPENAYLMDDKPGIFNLWFVRESSKIGHEGKTGTEWEYVFRRNLAGDIALVLKSIAVALFRSGDSKYYPEISIFGISFRNLRMSEAVEIIEKCVVERASCKKVFFVNPDCLNKTFSDLAYAEALRHSDFVFPDGSGMNLACKIIGKPLLENVNGTDMFPFLCRLSAEKKYSIYLLGARPGIAELVKINCEKRYPGVLLIGARDGYFDKDKESVTVVDEINRLNPDILLVAFGAPTQEKWILENASRLKARVCIGVGGLFDFYSGRISRAPRWMREFGLEWIFRFLQEPSRMWRRYIVGNPLFVFRVIKWKAFMEDSHADK
jgi:N-acetylglucosaminyldiphosphoundecaprenol N-acetyl-beta-D-mannosaminyltransferase